MKKEDKEWMRLWALKEFGNKKVSFKTFYEHFPILFTLKQENVIAMGEFWKKNYNKKYAR